MGKKTKKTTWRNLQIEDQQPSNSSITTISDSEESHSTINSFHSTNHYQRTRYHQGSGGGTGGRWGSAPPHHQRHASDERPARYNQQQRNWPNGGSGGGGSNQSTRLDRLCIGDGRYWATSYKGGGGGGKDTGAGVHQTKITFNEDEYTRITTPRQDVLFKKGYLNRPKPSLASTTDGSGSGNMDLVTPESNNSLLPSPDHVLLTPDSPFYYPTTGYIARDGLYFFNGFEPYPVVVYNAAQPQYCYSAAEFPLSSRSKCYSTDSMTESTSPHTEECSGVDGEAAPLFLPPTQNATAVQSSNSMTDVRRTQQLNNNPNNNQEANDESTVTNGINEQRKLKKKRRRKVSKPLTTDVGESTTTSVSVSSCEDDQQDTYSSSSDTEEITENNATAEKQEDSMSTCPNSPQSGSSSLSSMTTHSSLSGATEEQSSSKASSQLKPDAKEFIPRHFAALDFVQHSQPQFHVIDQHGFIQTAFLPLPILLSQVGPPQQFLLPPPAYNTINHLPRAEINEEDVNVKLTTVVEEVRKDMHIGKAVQLNDASKVVSLEDNAKALSIPSVESPEAIVQNSLSKSDIREIVFRLEEAAKEQEKSVKNHPRDSKNTINRFNNSKREKGKFSSAEATSPIRSNNAYKNSVSSSKMKMPQNVKTAFVEHQRKPYSNLLKQSQVVQSRATKPNQQQVNPSLKCKTLVGSTAAAAAAASMSNISNHPSPVSNKHVAASTVACSNQWINVSNRKKRRANNVNYTAEDQQLEDFDTDLIKDKPSTEFFDLKEELVVPEEDEEEEVQLNSSSQMDDGFEKYDIDKLVDVVVEDMKLEKCLESEQITELKIAPDEEVEIVVREIKIVEVAAATNAAINEINEKELKEIKDKHQNQKNKKPNSKNSKQIKRVMVTDNITPVVVKEIKETPIKKIIEETVIIKKNEEKREIVSHKKESFVLVCSSENTPSKSSKKSNKKKANSKLGTTNNPTATNIEKKAAADVSREDSSCTSYNFLPTNSENKTNIEVSQELDMLIQRGMYSSLEEKIRSFNITASNDGFFKTINYYGPGKLMNTENTFGNKDFNGILKDLKQPTMSSNYEIGIPTNISQNLTNNSNNGYQDFLGLGPDLHEPDKRLRTESGEASPLDVPYEEVEEEEQYPITRAVKEWMSKTREHTPDVELLKSPTTILKQFAKPAEASADLDDNEDEVTKLWSLSNQDSIETDQDLLDCWETEESTSCANGIIKSINKEDVFVGQVVLKGPNDARAVSQANQMEAEDVEDDDVLEVYERKYGKNEEFLRIREEWEERSKTAAISKNSCDSRKRRNVLPPTASLPYRAICCAIM